MSKCQHFKRAVHMFRSKEIARDHKGPTPIPEVRTWCGHAASPAPSEKARALGHAHALRCNGDTDQCQLPEGHSPFE
jgi:hypothetical protein